MPKFSNPNAQRAEAPANGPAPAPVDWPSTLTRIPGGTKVVRELAQILLDECPKQVAEIRTGIAQRDAVTAARGAHTLKGSADVFAAEGLVAQARQIELLARAGKLEDAHAALPQLECELDRLMAELRAWIDQNPP